jgi:hypothetical protein
VSRAGRLLCAAALAALAAPAPRLAAQTRGAELAREQKPVYPEALSKAIAQGNVVLIGRIDKTGAVQDAKAVWTTHAQLVEPTLTAVRAWVFRPALKDGKPVDIAANIVFPFRIRDEAGKSAGRELPGPALSELAVFPADAGGRKTAPEGFPLRAAAGSRVRAEFAIDVPALPAARKVTVKAEAVSPTGKRVPVFEDVRALKPREGQLRATFSAPVGADWEDGVWMIRFQVDKRQAGTGQFWLARDPDHYDFAAALKKK